MRYHVTLSQPVRIILGDDRRSTSIVAFDGEEILEYDQSADGFVRRASMFVTEAVYASRQDGSPTQMRMKTKLHLNERFIIGMWPLPEKR